MIVDPSSLRAALWSDQLMQDVAGPATAPVRSVLRACLDATPDPYQGRDQGRCSHQFHIAGLYGEGNVGAVEVVHTLRVGAAVTCRFPTGLSSVSGADLVNAALGLCRHASMSDIWLQYRDLVGPQSLELADRLIAATPAVSAGHTRPFPLLPPVNDVSLPLAALLVEEARVRTASLLNISDPQCRLAHVEDTMSRLLCLVDLPELFCSGATPALIATLFDLTMDTKMLFPETSERAEPTFNMLKEVRSRVDRFAATGPGTVYRQFM